MERLVWEILRAVNSPNNCKKLGFHEKLRSSMETFITVANQWKPLNGSSIEEGHERDWNALF